MGTSRGRLAGATVSDLAATCAVGGSPASVEIGAQATAVKAVTPTIRTAAMTNLTFVSTIILRTPSAKVPTVAETVPDANPDAAKVNPAWTVVVTSRSET